jgi:hypothetical protein
MLIHFVCVAATLQSLGRFGGAKLLQDQYHWPLSTPFVADSGQIERVAREVDLPALPLPKWNGPTFYVGTIE